MTAVPITADTIIHKRPYQEWLKLAKRYGVDVQDEYEVLHFIEQYRTGELVVEELEKSPLAIRLEQQLIEDEIKFRQLLESKFPHRSQWYRDELKKVFRR